MTAAETPEQADTRRLNWLEKNSINDAFCVGKTWYWRRGHGQPLRRAKNIRDAVDRASGVLA